MKYEKELLEGLHKHLLDRVSATIRINLDRDRIQVRRNIRFSKGFTKQLKGEFDGDIHCHVVPMTYPDGEGSILKLTFLEKSIHQESGESLTEYNDRIKQPTSVQVTRYADGSIGFSLCRILTFIMKKSKMTGHEYDYSRIFGDEKLKSKKFTTEGNSIDVSDFKGHRVIYLVVVDDPVKTHTEDSVREIPVGFDRDTESQRNDMDRKRTPTGKPDTSDNSDREIEESVTGSLELNKPSERKRKHDIYVTVWNAMVNLDYVIVSDMDNTTSIDEMKRQLGFSEKPQKYNRFTGQVRTITEEAFDKDLKWNEIFKKHDNGEIIDKLQEHFPYADVIIGDRWVFR